MIMACFPCVRCGVLDVVSQAYADVVPAWDSIVAIFLGAGGRRGGVGVCGGGVTRQPTASSCIYDGVLERFGLSGEQKIVAVL